MCIEDSKINNCDFALGRQMTVEYYECDPAVIGNGELMEKIFLEAAAEAGAHIISSNFHNFAPQGVSGVVIISESHFTVHAWPEHDYAAVDIFTCGENIDFDIAVETLQKGMKAESAIISSVMNRGIVSNNGMERFVPVFEDSNNRYSLSWKKRFLSTAATGMSSSVDIYDIFEGRSFSVDDVRIFAGGFVQGNELFAETSSISSYQLSQTGKGDLIVLYIEDGLKNACARFFLNENKVYLDIFSHDYFEPRQMAELAIKLLKGRSYRMQVAVRQ